jgi:hypothetical protein
MQYLIFGLFDSFLFFINDLVDSFFELILVFPQYIFQLIAEGVVLFFDWLPVPSFFSDAAGAFSGLPSDVIFYAQLFQVSEGITIVMGAYLIRFVIRRIPIIG